MLIKIPRYSANDTEPIVIVIGTYEELEEYSVNLYPDWNANSTEIIWK